MLATHEAGLELLREALEGLLLWELLAYVAGLLWHHWGLHVVEAGHAGRLVSCLLGHDLLLLLKELLL